MVWPPLERGAGDHIWILLPVAYTVVGLSVLWLARRIVRTGVVVVFFHS